MPALVLFPFLVFAVVAGEPGGAAAVAVYALLAGLFSLPASLAVAAVLVVGRFWFGPFGTRRFAGVVVPLYLVAWAALAWPGILPTGIVAPFGAAGLALGTLMWWQRERIGLGGLSRPFGEEPRA